MQVSAGDRHSLVLTESGDVFSFGDGKLGRLGHGDNEDQHVPKVVEALRGKGAVQVSAGSFHSLVLTESGDVFSCGDGDYGKLGHGDEEDQHVPKVVEALRGKGAVQVSAGHKHSLVLTRDNDVFAFGRVFEGDGGIEVKHTVPTLVPLEASGIQTAKHEGGSSTH